MSFINPSTVKTRSINESQQLRQVLKIGQDMPPLPPETAFEVFMHSYGRTMDQHFEVIRL